MVCVFDSLIYVFLYFALVALLSAFVSPVHSLQSHLIVSSASLGSLLGYQELLVKLVS